MPFAYWNGANLPCNGFEEESGQEHVALTMGDVSDGLPVLSRIHSECLTGDALFFGEEM